MDRPRTLRLARSALPLVLLGLLATATPAAADQLWEITTYGNGELLKSAFQGIALFASEGLPSALKIAALVALLSALFVSIGSVFGGSQSLMAIPNTALAAGVVAILSSVHVPVAIVDKVALSSDIVSGVPLPIAAIGYASSAFGERLAEKVEQAIYPVDFYGKFTESGLGWGPRVLQATLDATLIDMGLATDLDAYIRLCLIPDVESGHKTVDQVLKATTVEDMLGDSNPAIPILLPSQCNADGLPEGCTPPPADQRCPDAFTGSILPRLGAAAEDPNVLALIGQQIGKSNTTDVLPSISMVAQDLLQVSEDAVALLKLRFAANQLIPSIQANAALGGQNGLLTAWSIAEAEAQQTSAWITTGLLIQQVLPFFHATLEFLFYGFLLFGLPMIIIMPRIFPQVLGNAIWLQLWPLAYVMANRILYMQAVKAGLYSSQMGWGMSAASTQPITHTFNYAYAASGFPVAIGVMLLGGMIFGGQYAMQLAVRHGPWHTGAGMGTEAAMGNAGFGNMTLEQRSLAPRTERIDYDGRGNVGVRSATGPLDQPVVQRFESGVGMSTLIGAGEGSSWTFATPHNTLTASFSPNGVMVDSPYLNMAGSTQERAAAGESYTQAHSQSETARIALGESVAERSTEAYRQAASLANSTGDRTVMAARDSVQRQLSSDVTHALRESNLYTEVTRQAHEVGSGMDGFVGANLFGLTGGHYKADLSVRDSAGKEHTISLAGDQARRFAEAYSHGVSRDRGWEHTLGTTQETLRSHGQDFDFSTATQRQAEYGLARAAEERAGTTLEYANNAASLIESRGLGQFASFLWHQAGYRGELADARINHRPEAEAFLSQFDSMIRSDDKQELNAALREFHAAHPSQDVQQIRDAVREHGSGIGSVGSPLAGPEPGTPGQFRDAHRDHMLDPGSDTIHGQVARGLAGVPAAAIRGEADQAGRQTHGVPSKELLHQELGKGNEVQVRQVQDQFAEVYGGSALEIRDTLVRAGEQIGEATPGINWRSFLPSGLTGGDKGTPLTDRNVSAQPKSDKP
ncbi:MAG: conjugal transfer protein TraG N-terminal domain-containing protein [Candidatus Methylomirabilales bacterium]